jgi:trk system potassium uptake protein
MNIVIVGAGDIGSYIATLLSKQRHNVILIDKNGAKLEEIVTQFDVAIKQGSGCDWQLLDDLLEAKPDLFLALTSDDEVNLVACSIAKQLGYPRTIARVKDNRFLNRTRLDFARLFNVDYFIGPELLVAYDIYKHIIHPGTLGFESFAHGALQMRTLTVPSDWGLAHKSLSQLGLPSGVILSLIHRKLEGGKEQLIFPHGADHILPGDDITLIGEREQIADIPYFFGLESKKIKSVVLVGGSLIGINLAKVLQERKIDIYIIERNYKQCVALAEQLPKCHILHHEGTDLDFLLSEKIGGVDYFVACTNSDEVNVLAALVAKEAGCENVAIVLSNDLFVPLVTRLGIIHVVSPKLVAASRILSLSTSRAVTSLISLYENEAEIVEITVSMNSKIVGIPLAEMGSKLPHDFLIAMIQNRGRITIAKGDSVICPGDTVIVICRAQYFNELEKIF